METRQYHYIIKVLVVLPFYLFTFLPLSAQTFTERVQKEVQGQGKVTIHQSADIDNLVNDPNATGVQSQPAKGKEQTTSPQHPTPNTQTTKGKEQASNTQHPTPNTQATKSPSSFTTPSGGGGALEDDAEAAKKPVTGGRKITGYRVQAFAGGNSRKDRQMAEQTRNNIKAHYPNVPVFVHFYSPRWICRVGNYRTYEEAHQMMVNLQNLGYKQASIVKGKITVQY